MCCNYSICWFRVIKGVKLVWYTLGVTKCCSKLCCKPSRSREIHIIHSHSPWSGRAALLWCFSAWVAHYEAVMGCCKPALGVPLHDTPLSTSSVHLYWSILHFNISA